MKYQLNGRIARYDREARKYSICQGDEDSEDERSSYGKGPEEKQIRYYFEAFAALRERSFDLAIEKTKTLTNGKKVSVLDIGSSYGLFLKKVIEQGWDGFGVEPSRTEANFAREKFGVDVAETTIEDFVPLRKWDVITLWDVFEHLPNPTDALKKLKSLLRDDGILIIRVPNAKGLFHRLSFITYVASLGFVNFPLIKLFENHQYIYTEYALNQIVNQAGFDRIYSYGECMIDPDIRILRKKSYLVKIPNPLKDLIAYTMVLILRLSAALSMGDSLVVYFKQRQ
jgi:2-polyprenyl-3-methyl-5-hydroxy-6-metoxy-1,4-benzoquinol methylase